MTHRKMYLAIEITLLAIVLILFSSLARGALNTDSVLNLVPFDTAFSIDAQGNMPIVSESVGEHDPSLVIDIALLNPKHGQQISSEHTFMALVSVNGLAVVSFIIEAPNGHYRQTFSALHMGKSIWQLNLQGFTQGRWHWWVVARNISYSSGFGVRSPVASFIVDNREATQG